MNAARRLRRRSAKVARRVATALDAVPAPPAPLATQGLGINYAPKRVREINVTEARDMYPPPPDRSDYRRKIAALKTRR